MSKKKIINPSSIIISPTKVIKSGSNENLIKHRRSAFRYMYVSEYYYAQLSFRIGLSKRK